MTSGTYVLIGLGVGIGIGIGIAYFIQKMRAAPPSVSTTPPTSSLTSVTRDEQGRIIEIWERPMYARVG